MNTLTRICKYAMNDINNQLRKYQEKLILQKEYGADAVLDPIFHKHGDEYHAVSIYADLENNYLKLSAFAKKLQALIEETDDRAFQAAMNDFINSNQ